MGRLLRDVYLSWSFLNVRKNCLYLCSIFKFSNQYHPSSEKIKLLPDSVAFQFSVCVQTNGYWVYILLHIDCVCFMLWQKCFCLKKKHMHMYFADILPIFRKICSHFSYWKLSFFLGRYIIFLKTFPPRFLFKWFTVKFKFLYLGRIMFIYQPPVSRKFSGKADT